MDCPECGTGKIRVSKETTCYNHHFFICDNCLAVFFVECGEPFDATKLPPKYPMTLNKGMVEARERIIVMVADKAVNKTGKELTQEELQELVRKAMREETKRLPLLEDFRASLPHGASIEA